MTGFRASDESSIVLCYSPQCPKRGSTETEVFAACLAIQHAFKNCYNTLIIRTDNSKVEQLLDRPKHNDNDEYPVFCQTLNQYRQQNGNHAIRVERVRGHTTRFEQKQCKEKREFAKIDRLVRKKTRQYIKRCRIQYAQSYMYFYQYNHFFYNKWTVYRCLVYQF
jgi:ribonuclease HI